MDITKEWILENGFENNSTPYIGIFSKECVDCILELTNSSNMRDREWYLRVDNCDADTIGGCSVQTIEQVRAFLALLDIDFDKVLSQK